MIIIILAIWAAFGIYNYHKVLRDAEKDFAVTWEYYGEEFFRGEALFAACLGPIGTALLHMG